jgi:N-acetyl-anhydromuramoyl-L-alanine amidase
MINQTHHIDLVTGLLPAAGYQPSPHHDDRPDNTPIDMIVVHNISLPPGVFGGDTIEKFFCGTLDMTSHPAFAAIAHLRVSAHLLIKRNGDITQFVPFHKRAWHAGESSFAGKTRCNDFSIGIELEGTDHIPFEPQQYTQLANVIEALGRAYPHISLDRIVGHSDIAPSRKTDPGPAFDWNYLKGMLACKHLSLS